MSSRHQPIANAMWVLGAWAALGCASAGQSAVSAALKKGKVDEAIAVYDAGKLEDANLLAQIAERMLEQEALGQDARRRKAAMAQLKLSGTRARDVLKRLSRASSAPVVRAKALQLLAELGDDDANEELRRLLDSGGIEGGADGEIAAAALSVLEPERELDRIARALQATSAEVRLVAARLLARAAPLASARLALAEAARVDPVAAVRSAANAALGHYGPKAADVLEERLTDGDETARLAAIGALVRADYERAAAVMDRYLGSEPSAEGIVAARWLISEAGNRTEVCDRARAALFRFLSSAKPALRARAAVVLDALPSELAQGERLAERVREEKAALVRLPLAMVLVSLPDSASDGMKVLRELMKDGGVTAAQAAAELAQRGDSQALQKLLALRRDPKSTVRQIAARALAREVGLPHEARHALSDSDPMVRIAVAGAILAGPQNA